MIWGPFLLALALGIIVSAGLYFAYLWPQVEPEDDEALDPAGVTPTPAAARSAPDEEAAPAADPEAGTDGESESPPA